MQRERLAEFALNLAAGVLGDEHLEIKWLDGQGQRLLRDHLQYASDVRDHRAAESFLEHPTKLWCFVQ